MSKDFTAADLNWLDPDYSEVIAERARQLRFIRANPSVLPHLAEHYRTHPADFINSWAVTLDPRSIAKGRAALVPMILWDRQRELVGFLYERWLGGEPGVVIKSRDVGASWCAMALLATLCIFERNFAALVCSATEVKLDRVGDPDTLFEKVRQFVKHLPLEFRGGWSEAASPYLRCNFPATGSSITGEAGAAAGRGGRKSLIIVDESAHFHQSIAAALAATSDCVVHMSSVNGMANDFAVMAHNSAIPRFDIRYSDDPRKAPASGWYERKVAQTDPVVFAAEYDCNFLASVEGQLIPPAWVQSAINAHRKLGIEPSGARLGSFDVADEGRDKCAVAVRRGVVLTGLKSWSGKGGHVGKSTARAFGICEREGVRVLAYDADGLGGGVRAAAEELNGQRRDAGHAELEVIAFRGSSAVFDPEGSLVEGRLNRDHFQNLKAQAWWALRDLFYATHRAVTEGAAFDVDHVIAIDGDLPELNQLISELSQPTYGLSVSGKVVIDKVPDGAASPNLADSVMMLYSPFQPGAAYFGAGRAGSTRAAVSPVMAELPRMDVIFAVLVIQEDSAGVIYGASHHGDGDRGCALIVLDWDLRELDVDTPIWVEVATERLHELHRDHYDGFARLCGFYTDKSAEGWAENLREMGLPVSPIGEKDLPTMAERFNAARPYFSQQLVLLAPFANARELTYRGVRRNFLRELLAAPVVPESSALASALATGCLLVYRGRKPLGVINPNPAPWRAPVVLESAGRPRLPTVAPGPAPPRHVPGQLNGVFLRKGIDHEVDGKVVHIPRTGEPDEPDDAFLELPPGRHSVDGRGVRL